MCSPSPSLFLFLLLVDIPEATLNEYDVKVNRDGKVEITFFKVEKTWWWQMCPKLKFVAQIIDEREVASGVNFRTGCHLVSKQAVTHDTSLYRFNLPDSTRMIAPVGSHVFLRLSGG